MKIIVRLKMKNNYFNTFFKFNLFLPTDVPIIYPLKTPENQRLSGVFRGIKWEHWPEIG